MGAVAKDFAKGFYLSNAWQRTRTAYYKFRCGICERCKGAGDIVHHKTYITPRNINNPRITLDFANLELLCQDCHNKEHFKKTNKRYAFDANGKVIPPVPRENR